MHSGAHSDYQAILDFWFPEGKDLAVDPKWHAELWAWRMQGLADAEIVSRLTDLTERAQTGAFDHWAEVPHGRLALIIVLDQFPRSIWRATPRAYANDERTLALCLDGHENGHYAALEVPWFKTTYNLPLGHCEGPDHLARLDFAIQLGRDLLKDVPAALRPGYEFAASQPVEVKKVISRFGRHPHRNADLGRPSTPEEIEYIATGAFPHLRKPDYGNEYQ